MQPIHIMLILAILVVLSVWFFLIRAVVRYARKRRVRPRR